MITRVCGAILRDCQILMVHHIHDGRDYWTLPGGHVEDAETPEQAVVREIQEETGLETGIQKVLFDEEGAYTRETDLCRCFLLKPLRPTEEPELGTDPEEDHLDPQVRMLRELRWCSLEGQRDDRQVSRVIEALGIET